MKALIFNSGLGKRMGQLTENNPKSMVRLDSGETIFERQLRVLKDCGITDFVITVGPFKEQLIEVSQREEYRDLKFTFVENPVYDQTNYIYSMYLAKDYLNDDFLMLHGDLVFNKELVEEMISDPIPSICLYNEEKALPEKDFKGRFENGLLREVSINIFDSDCYAFQPLYKLSKADMNAWLSKVDEFITNGVNSVYAENALNRVNTTWGEGWLKANKDNNSVIIYPNDPYAKVYERIWYASENIRNEALKDGIFLSF